MLTFLQNGRCSFIFTTLLLHTTTLKSPLKIGSSVNFYFPIPPIFVHKIIFTISINNPFLYTSVIFHLSVFTYNRCSNLHQKHFLWSQAASRDQGAIGNLVIIITRDHNHWFLTAQAQKIGFLQISLWWLESVCNQNGNVSNPPLSHSKPIIITSIHDKYHHKNSVLSLAFSYTINTPLLPYV